MRAVLTVPELPEVETLRRGPVKATLLDQAAVAGIGNIYADEVLHRARIHPAQPAGGLSQAETLRLHAAIQEILRAAVDSGGTSFAGYLNDARGRPGYLGQAHVFRRQGPALPGVRNADRPRHGRGPRDELLPALTAALR